MEKLGRAFTEGSLDQPKQPNSNHLKKWKLKRSSSISQKTNYSHKGTN
jgi:hypothetical protein